jgi:hypothetical protein
VTTRISTVRYISDLHLQSFAEMRYENWDVLLFPEGSKVPIQEFRTQCFVTRDQGELRPLLIIVAVLK